MCIRDSLYSVPGRSLVKRKCFCVSVSIFLWWWPLCCGLHGDGTGLIYTGRRRLLYIFFSYWGCMPLRWPFPSIRIKKRQTGWMTAWRSGIIQNKNVVFQAGCTVFFLFCWHCRPEVLLYRNVFYIMDFVGRGEAYRPFFASYLRESARYDIAGCRDR